MNGADGEVRKTCDDERGEMNLRNGREMEKNID
jgi:hypothetical protein